MLNPTTTVPTPVWARTLIWLCVPLAGAGLLYLAIRVIVWIPLPFGLGFIRDLPGTAALFGSLGVGALLGAILAALIDRESLTVRITHAEVVLTRPGTTVTLPRGDVAVAFRDHDHLVLLGRTGRELAHEPCHVSAARLAPAFTANGIAWADQDPYEDAFRRWVPDLPDLPAGANAVFAARQKALDSGDDSDLRDLRGELDRLGFAVRDRKKKQYWRRVL